jgi:hypothetical protein
VLTHRIAFSIACGSVSNGPLGAFVDASASTNPRIACPPSRRTRRHSRERYSSFLHFASPSDNGCVEAFKALPMQHQLLINRESYVAPCFLTIAPRLLEGCLGSPPVLPLQGGPGGLQPPKQNIDALRALAHRDTSEPSELDTAVARNTSRSSDEAVGSLALCLGTRSWMRLRSSWIRLCHPRKPVPHEDRDGRLGPTIGHLHTSTPERQSFVLDLMEPQRPLVDRKVLEFVEARTLHPASTTPLATHLG